MSNSVFVPVHRLPASLDEVQQAVGRAFEGFGLAPPKVQLHKLTSQPKALADSIVTVRGNGVHEHCWVSFGEYPTELTGADAATHMGDVTTRGSWLFAAVVVMALFEFGGSTAFNDSGELDGRPEYDAEVTCSAFSSHSFLEDGSGWDGAILLFELAWGQLVQAAVRTNCVVVAAPSLNDDYRLAA